MWASISVLKSMEEVIEETADYTRNRQVFGGPLLDNQAVHFRLAELTCEVEALRSLIYRAIESYIGGKDATRLASMAKLKGGKLVREVADWCVQFHGGMGYMWETRVNRFYRDARLLSIGGGADEVMMAIIAKFEGTLPGKGNR